MQKQGFRIGRLFEIDIVADWSWTFIAALMTLNVTAAFHRWHSGWSWVGSFALACLAMVLFFASLLAHEFAHSLVAKSLGLSVTNIRLFLFGGVSNVDRDPPSPGGEFAM